ncbi:Oligopeptide transport system permease protein OppC [Piscirickettsia salmonis]|uniref:Oligopeptide transport system permease protein OppC n=3 Tax=Piscirickettsia salmonis TaxID=1238 RepID=A0A9Q6LMR6_PISSA|nr:hypothetical protein [Piscirickettsia salmonis]QGN94311.1 Oligopeptide transport system permease protein OppC [Piscirickettsia salmonis]QGO06739.1 Oligopeptide transport system permease protein OppC [Piscirickettsia salmonis]QGO35065.1 Oligopeptide transport system permease protein OppC [Piscirickettsia salmonis]QGO38683.1 Oligopeptide transport system permease protein OppC [Piscirickettsia salmonis]QGO42298.1 Oligopeptide transport system permease protein OppC [Piscirickettsia salmonis]
MNMNSLLSVALQMTEGEQEITGRSLWADAMRRFFNNKGAVVSLAILVILIVAIIIGPWLSSYTIE